jgi:hypothetical protein
LQTSWDDMYAHTCTPDRLAAPLAPGWHATQRRQQKATQPPRPPVCRWTEVSRRPRHLARAPTGARDALRRGRLRRACCTRAQCEGPGRCAHHALRCLTRAAAAERRESSVCSTQQNPCRPLEFPAGCSCIEGGSWGRTQSQAPAWARVACCWRRVLAAATCARTHPSRSRAGERAGQHQHAPSNAIAVSSMGLRRPMLTSNCCAQRVNAHPGRCTGARQPPAQSSSAQALRAHPLPR